jgi:hypothetical protein
MLRHSSIEFADIDQPAKVISTTVEIVDIAGLVKGQAKVKVWEISFWLIFAKQMPLFTF